MPQSRWLLIQLLLLGAVTNAILLWTAHFAVAILRTPAPAGRGAEIARLALLNVGVLGVLAGGSVGPAWLAVTGAAGVFAAVAAHLTALAARLRRALPARFAVTVHYYLAACVALLAGIPAGRGCCSSMTTSGPGCCCSTHTSTCSASSPSPCSALC